MTSAATLVTVEQDPPLVRAYTCLTVFCVLFCEFFERPVNRYPLRAVHAKACALIRAMEALVRNILLTRAAILAETLPAAIARAAAKRTGPVSKPPPAQAADRPPVFCAFRRADFGYPVQRVAGVRPAARPAPSLRVDLAPLARRYAALASAIHNPDSHVRRVALRLRALKARAESVALFTSPRVHPEHKRYIERDLHALHEDANAALRQLFWNSS